MVIDIKLGHSPSPGEGQSRICMGKAWGIVWLGCAGFCDVRTCDLCGHCLRGFAQLK